MVESIELPDEDVKICIEFLTKKRIPQTELFSWGVFLLALSKTTNWQAHVVTPSNHYSFGRQ